MLGQHEKGVEAAWRALRLNSPSAATRVNLAENLLRLNRFAEAKEVSEAALRRGLDNRIAGGCGGARTPKRPSSKGHRRARARATLLSVLYPLAQLGLARSAALNGDAAKARKAYEDFFTLWKDAEPDLAPLQAGKREYQQLRSP